jgi:myosin heavy subunit
MDVLNEPEILNNLKHRYRQDRIFTKIGPTLIVVNPYKRIDALFNGHVRTDLRRK